MLKLIDFRFVFGSQSKYFLRKAEAHRNIASTCMSYLTFESCGTDTGDFELATSVLAGCFVLQTYAESQWFEHLKAGVREGLGTPLSEEFYERLAAFLNKLANPTCESYPTESRSSAKDFQTFKKEWPEIYGVLERVCKFREWQMSDQTAAYGERIMQPTLPLSFKG